MTMHAPTFPHAEAAPPASARPPSSLRQRIALYAFIIAIVLVSRNAASAPLVAAASTAFGRWSSIMLAALPYVVGGTIVAYAARRLVRRNASMPLALVAIASPGCDCAGSGYAFAFADASPALAGFTLTWSAAAGPVALVVTRAALGAHVLIARVAGAAIAALVTAALWTLDARAASRATAHACRDEREVRYEMAGQIGSAVLALAVSAAIATVLISARQMLPPAFASPLSAGISGAILSPCSTADAVLARVLFTQAASQGAFVIAAQCLDTRQMLMLVRVFGWRRAALAAAAGTFGCVAATLCAR